MPDDSAPTFAYRPVSGALLDVPQTLARLGNIHVTTLNRIVARGDLHRTKVGRRSFYNENDIAKYLNRDRDE